MQKVDKMLKTQISVTIFTLTTFFRLINSIPLKNNIENSENQLKPLNSIKYVELNDTEEFQRSIADHFHTPLLYIIVLLLTTISSIISFIVTLYLHLKEKHSISTTFCK